jgi:Tol biopolymer transport system component
MSMIGKTLAHYEITSQLGKGGMGEVYQAKDRKLGRDVAIKVLPEEFARDTDRVARFQREAKLLASLNHPNIAAIHGLEESGGIQFLVLELVEGQTLADRIKAGPVPVEEALKLALQIAEALEAAHEKGVIHRDLKPANIKVTPEGKVKVLDFGLAKAYAGDREEVNLSNSPTLSDAATQQGVILGTAAYMSPEQARGKTVDKRADIWAFGAVLFEMLTGQAAFQGEDVTEILAAVVKGGADLDLLPANLHPRVREVITRCLQRDLRRRYSTITDARYEIEQALADPGGVLVQQATAVKPRRKLRLGLPWVAAVFISGLIVAGVAVWKMKPTEPRQVMRFEYELPEGQQLSGGTVPNLAVSPDGKQFVYGTTKGLYLRSADELAAKPIVGTEGETRQPIFSPDGKWIAYISQADRKLKKVAVTGGAPVALCDITSFLGASWSADDTIMYGTMQGAIMRISANGGTPEPFVKSKANYLVGPQILPGGKSVLYSAADAGLTHPRIMVQSLKSGETKELCAGVLPRYLPTGHIIHRLPNNSNIFAISFALDRLQVVGGSVPVVEGVSQAAVSDAGTLAFITGTTSAAAPAQHTLVWVDRKGKEEAIAAPPNTYGQPKISPDGTRVALSVGPLLNEDIWIWDIVRKTLTRLTFDKTRELVAIWTPDSKRIIYWSNHEDASNGGIYWKPADGTGGAEKLGSAPDRQAFPYSLSSDGKTLLTQEVVTMTNLDIGMLSMEADHKRKELLQSEYEEAQPMISPDGRWMAYASNEATGVSLKTDIYVRPFPEVSKGKWQVSTSGGSCPLWSPDGRELFYLSADNSVMAVAVETKPTISFGTPKMLFKSTYLGLTSASGTPWDIHPDGKRFLMIKPSAPTAATPGAATPRPKINIVLNWFEELKQRVPGK